ncbi:MAG: DUF1415 domain-containing protein [Saprospiraceae bacterium]
MNNLAAAQQWVDDFVIRLGLCPFAAPVRRAGQVRFVTVPATDEDGVYRAFLAEAAHLLDTPAEEIATTILICTHALTDFDDYWEFTGACESALAEAGLAGTLQLATFHPHYVFADTEPDDPANRTNRSPLPLLQLLREAGITAALASYPGKPEDIPERNKALLRKMAEE